MRPGDIKENTEHERVNKVFQLNTCVPVTVNSRKSQTLFINYDFRWLMVAEIFRK